MNISRLAELRMNNDYKQQYIAMYLNTTQQQYSKYELGIRTIPIEQLSMLADLYNVSIDYILSRTDVKTHYPKKIKEIQRLLLYFFYIIKTKTYKVVYLIHLLYIEFFKGIIKVIPNIWNNFILISLVKVILD